MDKKIIISLLTSIALSTTPMAQTNPEDPLLVVNYTGLLTLQIIAAFDRQIEDPHFNWDHFQATRTRVSQWLNLVKARSFLIRLEEFKQFESIDLREYYYRDSHQSIHLNVHAYKDNLIQQFMSSYKKLLELSNTSFWPENTIKKILIQNMDVLVDIKNLATAYQDHHNPETINGFGLYKK